MINPIWLASPLDPTPDEGRAWLRRELVKPEYHKSNPFQRLLDWFWERFSNLTASATETSWLQTAISLLVLAVLLLALLWLISRARWTRRAASESGPVLGDEAISARELRERAETAMAEGRFADAVVDGFRAVTVRQIEHGRIDDQPGMTAREVATALEASYPPLAERIHAVAGLFDAVLYGDRPATREQAATVLALDDELVGVR